jgi:hypothetical protein
MDPKLEAAKEEAKYSSFYIQFSGSFYRLKIVISFSLEKLLSLKPN